MPRDRATSAQASQSDFDFEPIQHLAVFDSRRYWNDRKLVSIKIVMNVPCKRHVSNMHVDIGVRRRIRSSCRDGDILRLVRHVLTSVRKRRYACRISNVTPSASLLPTRWV